MLELASFENVFVETIWNFHECSFGTKEFLRPFIKHYKMLIFSCREAWLGQMKLACWKMMLTSWNNKFSKLQKWILFPLIDDFNLAIFRKLTVIPIWNNLNVSEACRRKLDNFLQQCVVENTNIHIYHYLS